MRRSGTSFLQALLAKDPDSLVSITGHGMVPMPPPGVLNDEAARTAPDGRIIAFQRDRAKVLGSIASLYLTFQSLF